MANDASRTVPRAIAAGACLALLSIIFGFIMGTAFGAAEDSIKGHLEAAGNEALETAYAGDVAAKDAVVKKSWDYLKRAHLHGGGIGAAALGSIAMLVLLCRMGVVAQVSAVSFGAGALIYSIYWLFAGLRAPGMGSTGEAKESLDFLAIPGAGLCLLGVFGTLFCVLASMCCRPAKT